MTRAMLQHLSHSEQVFLLELIFVCTSVELCKWQAAVYIAQNCSFVPRGYPYCVMISQGEKISSTLTGF